MVCKLMFGESYITQADVNIFSQFTCYNIIMGVGVDDIAEEETMFLLHCCTECILSPSNVAVFLCVYEKSVFENTGLRASQWLIWE